MELDKPLVDRKVILDLLYGDEDYVEEFAEASIESFTEFKQNFSKYLRKRDEENLRKAGHKIKPVAQMMNQNELLKMYEKSKELLQEDAPDEEINRLIDRMNKYCNQLLGELKKMSE